MADAAGIPASFTGWYDPHGTHVRAGDEPCPKAWKRTFRLVIFASRDGLVRAGWESTGHDTNQARGRVEQRHARS